jgi:hypothetical protein
MGYRPEYILKEDIKCSYKYAEHLLSTEKCKSFNSSYNTYQQQIILEEREP